MNKKVKLLLLMSVIICVGIISSLSVSATATSENYALGATAYATHSREHDLFKLEYINDGTVSRWQTFSNAQNPSIILDLGTNAPVVNQVKLAYHSPDYINIVHSFSVTASDKVAGLPSDGSKIGTSIKLSGDVINLVQNQKTVVDKDVWTGEKYNIDENMEVVTFEAVKKRYICISLTTDVGNIALAEIGLYNSTLASEASVYSNTSFEKPENNVTISGLNDGAVTSRWAAVSTVQNPVIVLDLGENAPIVNQVKLTHPHKNYIGGFTAFSVTASDTCDGIPTEGAVSTTLKLTGDIVHCVTDCNTTVSSENFVSANNYLDENKEIVTFAPVKKRYICISLKKAASNSAPTLTEIELFNTNLATRASVSATTCNTNPTYNVGVDSLKDATAYRWQAISTDQTPRIIFDFGENPPVVDKVKLSYYNANSIDAISAFSVTASDYCAGEGRELNLIGDIVKCVTNQETVITKDSYTNWNLDSNKEIASFTPVQKRYICISLTKFGEGIPALAEIELYGDATDEELVQIELGNLDVDTTVTEDIYLPQTGIYGSEILWTSNNSAVSDSGVVTRDSYDGIDQDVTLTAKVTKRNATGEKQLTTKVLKLPMFNFDEVIYKDNDTTYVNEYSAIPANNTLVVRGKINKNTTNQDYAENQAGMFVALYDKDGKLVDVKKQSTGDSNKQADGSFLIDNSLQINFVPDGHYIKTFLLDNKTIVPYDLDEFPKQVAKPGACIYTDPTQGVSYYANANPNLPNVLVIGDSISQGYRTLLRSDFENGGALTSNVKANVYYIPQNGGSTERGLEKLDYWLGNDQMPWKVITFNFGLHDLLYSDYDVVNGTIAATVDVYGERLTEFVNRLKAKYDGTETNLIWVNTTHVPASSNGRVEGSEVAYNEKAAEIMAANNIPIVDLWSIDMAAYDSYENGYHNGIGNVHFTESGYRAFADVLSPAIATAIIEK